MPMSAPGLRPLAAACLLSLAAAGLAGCGGSDQPRFAPECPVTTVLQDATDLTRFRGAGHDLTGIIVDGRIIGFSRESKCSLDDPTHLHTVLFVNFELARGPAATGRDVEVTYFVAVSRGDTILDKQDYRLAVQFPRNTERVRVTGERIDLVLPVDAKITGPAYSIRAAFQLTPDELAFNRRRGVR